jgi:hypothetical protein
MNNSQKSVQLINGDFSDQLNKPVSNNLSLGIRRSRFPRAQPNIAISSGMARMRRLSGHYTSINSVSQASPSNHNECEISDNNSVFFDRSSYR